MCMIWSSCLGSVYPLRKWEARKCHAHCMGVAQPGSVSFVSDRPGAYGRLLLAVYVRWKTDLLVSSDWLRPVTPGGGGGWRVRGSVDVS